MPASPISKKLTDYEFPKDWKSLNKVIIPDSKTAHYYGIWLDKGIDSYADLMCCYIDDNPSLMVSWGHVEEMEGMHRPILDTIRDVFGVSFHKRLNL